MFCRDLTFSHVIHVNHPVRFDLVRIAKIKILTCKFFSIVVVKAKLVAQNIHGPGYIYLFIYIYLSRYLRGVLVLSRNYQE